MSAESDLLRGLRDTVITPAIPAGTVTLFGLSDLPDVQAAIGFTRGPTEPLGRWGQGVLTLTTRGERADPLSTHDLADPLVKALLSVADATLGAVAVNTCEHRGSSTGLDGSKRTVRIDTFFLDLDYQA